MSTPPDPDEIRHWSDSLSAAWERHRTRLFESQRRVSEWLVDQVDPKPGNTILELAAGPGETGFLIAEQSPGVRVISTDLSDGMVAAARRGASERGLTNVECRVMNAQEIDLPDASVDGVVCRFGLMLMPDPADVMAGVRRVLRPGGRVAYAVWGAPDRNPWMSSLAMAVVENGHQPPGNPFGPGGPFSLADPQKHRELTSGAGLEDVAVEELSDVMHFDDPDDYWNLQTEVSGPLALFISALSDDERAAVKRSLQPMLEGFATKDGFGLPTLAIGVAAVAP